MSEAHVAEPASGAGLLAEPAHRAVRVVARARLRETLAGYELFLGGNPEGLHDLRVALRRLRTWIRAFRPWVDDTLTKKTRRRLSKLAQATNAARDAEVAAEWVKENEDGEPRLRAGFDDALRRLEAERDDALKDVRETLARDLPSLLEAMAAQLSLTHGLRGPLGAELMADAVWPVIEQHAARVSRALSRVKSASDIDEAHRARIAAKRLRYILEPLHEASAMRENLAPLVELQDSLGAARDAHQLARRYVREIGEMAARDARWRVLAAIGVRRPSKKKHATYRRVRPGLIELARRAHLAERRSYAAFQRHWGRDQSDDILAALEKPFAPVPEVEVAPAALAAASNGELEPAQSGDGEPQRNKDLEPQRRDAETQSVAE